MSDISLDVSKIKAITLDLDDTLWPVWPAIERAELILQQWLAERAPLTAGLFADARQRLSLRETVSALHPEWGHDLGAIRLGMIRQGLEQAGEGLHHATAAYEVFLAARMEVTLYDDALQGLARLAAHYPLFAVTNGNADIHRVGIGQHFAGSVSARDAGVGKPDPRIFQAAATKLRLHPHEVLHVGDDALLDVVAAIDFGMQAVWINRNNHVWSHAPQPHAQATDLLELCALLRV